MQKSVWTRLSTSSSPPALDWRVVELDVDGRTARVRPQLAVAEVRRRLDEVLGVEGWSFAFRSLPGGAVACELSALGATKSAVAAPTPGRERADGLADDALVRAAELLGARPEVDQEADYFSEIDPQTGAVLYEPEARGAAQAPAAPPAPEEPAPEPEKPAGQQAIDRLIERLRSAGLGLQAAQLVMEHGGYGADPEEARELYAKLRALLLEQGSATS